MLDLICVMVLPPSKLWNKEAVFASILPVAVLQVRPMVLRSGAGRQVPPVPRLELVSVPVAVALLAAEAACL